jgi:tetratricopeptide (TPR) repeat protein
VQALTNKDTIVLSDFDNKTNDSVFDDTLKQGLSVQLEQSPFLNLLSDRKISETLKLMGRSASERLTPEVTHEVCQRTGSTALLTGSIAALNTQYVIGLKAVNCNTGDVLAETQSQATGKESVLKALDTAAVTLRSKLGESLNSVQRYATPLAEATTSSLDALKAYSLAVKAAGRKDVATALPLLQRALELDPNFAMAQSTMGGVYLALNEVNRATEYTRRAYALRGKVSERERFSIENQHYFLVTGELERMAQNLELWRQTYPRDSVAVMWTGFNSMYLGNWEKALDGFREAQRLDPDWVFNYTGLGGAATALGRLDDAEAAYKEAEDRKLENEGLPAGRYALAFLKGNQKQMAQIVSAAIGKSAAEHMLLGTQANTEAWYGKLRRAHELTVRAIDSALRKDAKESAAGYQTEAALREVEAGNPVLGRAEAKAALMLTPNGFVPLVAALVLARAGDIGGAEKLAAEGDKAAALSTSVQRYWLPVIRAAVALQRQDPNGAIERLKMASAIELSFSGPVPLFLAPAYLRGEAYLMLHDGKRAADEFQKLLDHRGLVVNGFWGALARLGLARAYALQSDTAKARAAYQDFLTLWKDADPGLPLLKQAQAEYARLK